MPEALQAMEPGKGNNLPEVSAKGKNHAPCKHGKTHRKPHNGRFFADRVMGYDFRS
jgi:hypothetical protein